MEILSIVLDQLNHYKELVSRSRPTMGVVYLKLILLESIAVDRISWKYFQGYFQLSKDDRGSSARTQDSYWGTRF
jgi:hypothetical protein